MIGATAAEFQDLWSTPLGPARPGVWIQAIAYRTLAAEQAGLPVLAAPGRGVALLLAALLGVDRRVALAAAARSPQRRARDARRRLAARRLSALVVSRGVLLACVVPLGQLAAHYVLGLERVRQRFQRRLVERERSLVTLFSVGEATAAPASGDVLGVALSLLGDVVGASGVALLRASPTGELDGRRVDWGAAAAAARSATKRRPRAVCARRTCASTRDGAPGRSGAGCAVYAPLFAGDVPVGVLVVERQQQRAARRRPSCARSPPSARRSRSRWRTCDWSRACARRSTHPWRRSRARSRRATATRSSTAGGSRCSPA